MSGKLKPCESVVVAEVGAELVLLNVESGIYFGLDPVGTRIWQLLSEAADEETVVARLLEEYEVAEDQLRDDLERLVEQLTEHGLLARTNGQSS